MMKQNSINKKGSVDEDKPIFEVSDSNQILKWFIAVTEGGCEARVNAYCSRHMVPGHESMVAKVLVPNFPQHFLTVKKESKFKINALLGAPFLKNEKATKYR